MREIPAFHSKDMSSIQTEQMHPKVVRHGGRPRCGVLKYVLEPQDGYVLREQVAPKFV